MLIKQKEAARIIQSQLPAWLSEGCFFAFFIREILPRLICASGTGLEQARKSQARFMSTRFN
jgi:hypothetical protein